MQGRLGRYPVSSSRARRKNRIRICGGRSPFRRCRRSRRPPRSRMAPGNHVRRQIAQRANSPSTRSIGIDASEKIVQNKPDMMATKTRSPRTGWVNALSAIPTVSVARRRRRGRPCSPRSPRRSRPAFAGPASGREGGSPKSRSRSPRAAPPCRDLLVRSPRPPGRPVVGRGPPRRRRGRDERRGRPG